MTTQSDRGGPMTRALAARAVRLTAAIEANGLVHGAGVGATDLVTEATPPVPAHVAAAAKDALARGETHYTGRPGIPELRGAIARSLTAEGFPVAPAGVVVTNGGAEALYIVLQALVAAGTRVVVPEPVLPNVAAMIGFIGGDLVRVPTAPPHRFAPDAATLLAASGDVVLVATPSPVSGVAMAPAEVRALAAGVAAAGGVLVLDRSLAPAAIDAASVAFDAPDLGGDLVLVGSFSAGYGLAGWRVGYFAAPDRLIETMRGLKQAMSICTTAVSQFAALAALDDVGGWQGARRGETARLVTDATERLAVAGLPVVAPDAGPALLVDTRAIDADDVAVAGRLAAAGVTVQPSSAFGAATAGFVRVTLGAGSEREAAVDRIAALAGQAVTTGGAA